MNIHKVEVRDSIEGCVQLFAHEPSTHLFLDAELAKHFAEAMTAVLLEIYGKELYVEQVVLLSIHPIMEKPEDLNMPSILARMDQIRLDARGKKPSQKNPFK